MVKEHNVLVEWRGMEIHPEIPTEGEEIPAHRADQRRAGWENVRRLATEAGLEMNMPVKRVNTRLALQAAEFAKDQGAFDAFHCALFAAYFTEGRDVGDMEVLLSLAAENGLKPEELRLALEEGRYLPRLQTFRQQAAEDVISGVPTFIKGGLRVVGAQPYVVIQKVFFAGSR